jgi:3-deoxy-manno-octulosonate cytidylyltransferase (CMP-KDO synthetase)|tara:strand:- start:7398 stop:8075 length:678 start_codon:yes stop_codon:yes gene_type:complete
MRVADNKKPLWMKAGKSLLRYTFEAACRARKFDRIMIATNSGEIEQHVSSWGAQVVRSEAEHSNGTRRVAEAVYRTANCAEVIVNLQLNEPEMPGAYLDALVSGVGKAGSITTLAAPFPELDSSDKNTVKVIVSKAGRALYFTRSIMAGAKQHLGCYGFKVQHLERIADMPTSAIATAERLEQLEWIDNGMEVSVIRVDRGCSAINTEEDWERWQPPTDENRVII